MLFYRLLWAALGLLGSQFILGCHAVPDQEFQSIEQALAVETGSILADVGTGDGKFVGLYSRLVGEGGLVYGTEIDPELVGELQDLVIRDSLANVRIVQATTEATGLPEACCDAVVLRHVYHHLTDPQSTLQDLHRAVRPGGTLLIIDFQPSVLLAPWLPKDLPEDRSGHGITAAIIAAEATDAGFEAIGELTDWPGSHLFMDRLAMVLKKPDRQL